MARSDPERFREQEGQDKQKEIKIMNKFKINKSNHRLIIAGGLISVAMLLAADALPISPAHAAGRDKANTQTAELYQLQAAFHAAASCAGLDRDQHIQDMLALWTEDGVLIAGSTTYQGRGVWNGSSCSPAGPTLCDFFANHAGPFVSGRAWVGLSASFQTAIDVLGDTATLFFECHYFDVSTTPPQWKSDASYGVPGQPLTGLARKVNGKWLLSYAVAASPPLSCN